MLKTCGPHVVHVACGTCPCLFCNIQHNAYPQSSISIKHIKHQHLMYPKTTGIFLTSRSINICILNNVHVNISQLVNPLNTKYTEY